MAAAHSDASSVVGCAIQRVDNLRILMIGDVIGKPGRNALSTLVPELRDELALDLVIANGENSAGGFGLTLDTSQEMLSCGVNMLTSGNHVWAKKEILPFLDEGLPIIRPANYPPSAPGRGHMTVKNALVLNLMGRVFMAPLDCPFRTADRLLEEARRDGAPRIIIVDMHAEATSEKQAMGWYLDGRVSAVLGTHTHVGTVDARILPKGTGFITDVGMTGPYNSVIGSDRDAVIERFLTQMPQRLTPPGGPVILNSVLLEVDDDTGMALSIERVDRMVN